MRVTMKPYPSGPVLVTMQNPRPKYRADLEALRGLAILLVVAYHAGVPIFAGGFVGVDVFFVLSGYFMGRSLIEEYATTGTLAVGQFWRHRARRLLPPLLVVVAATLLAVWTLWAPIDRPQVADVARAVLLGVPNVAFAAAGVNYFAGPRSPFLHTWSLGVEIQIAVFGPLLFLALARIGGGRAAPAPGGERARRLTALVRGVGVGMVVAAALSLGTGVWLTATDPAAAYFSTTARAWEFIAGTLLVLVLPSAERATAIATGERGRGSWLQAGGLAAVAAGALLYDRSTLYPGTAALLPVVGTLAVIAGGSRARALLEADGRTVRALGALGRVSYSWYLWHWPVVLTAAVLVPTLGAAGRLAWSAAALAPAWLTSRWVERPLRESRDAAAPKRPWIPAAAVGACLTLALATAVMRHAAARSIERGAQRTFAAARADRMPHTCWAENRGAPSRAGSATCAFGNPAGAATVALFGDSHAEHWLAALDRLGQERGWRVVVFVKGGCPVAAAPELVVSRTDRYGEACAQWRDETVRRLIALHPDVAVLSSFDDYVTRVPEPIADRTPGGISPAAWERGLRRTYARVAGARIPVVVIRGTPRPGFDVPACLSRRDAGLPLAAACEYELKDALHYAARDAQLAAIRAVTGRGLPVTSVDLTGEVCASSPCKVVQDGQVVFTDDNHLTASFTRASAGALGTALDAALAPLGVRLP